MPTSFTVTYAGEVYVWNQAGWSRERDNLSPPGGLAGLLDATYAQQITACKAEVEVEQLKTLVDGLMKARTRNETHGVRKRSLDLLSHIDEMRRKHVEKAFPAEVVEAFAAEQKRSGLDFGEMGKTHRSICWDCNDKGLKTELDKRLDPECPACSWAICPVCGACQDPAFGDCGERTKRDRNRE